jgi:uncharacterized surface protein with fasciclin (FAS1) repeats
MRNRIKFLLLLSLFATGFFACKKWDDHIKVSNPGLNENLLQAIAANTNLSKFNEYLQKTGMDSVLRSSKTFTVWAPANAALANLDPAIINDQEKLKQFIQNHISNQSYDTRTAVTSVRVPMLNGKYSTFLNKKIEEANITEADHITGNGVLHVIDKALPVLSNAWEFVNNTVNTYNQSKFIVAQNFDSFDPSQAVVDSISSNTGLPVYKPGTGIVKRNSFNDKIADLKREDKQYTFFVMDNSALKVEADSLNPYFKTSTQDSTNNYSTWYVIRDLAFDGLISINSDTVLTAKSSAKVPITKNAIVETKKISNGIVYVMNKVDFKKEDKIQQFIIQGENPRSFMADRRNNTYYRTRLNPVTNQPYNDIVVSGHGLTGYYINYRISETPTVKYKVYGVAVNDFQTGAFTQNLVIGSPVVKTLAYAVPLNTTAGSYNEVLLGDFTPDKVGVLDLFLTASGTSPLTLDYLRLEPSFQ